MLEAAIAKLEALGAKKVFVQAPEGLKTRVQALAGELEAAGIAALVSVEPCFGACDLRDREAKALGCDALLHIGHTDFGVKAALPVVYEPYRMEVDVVPLLERHASALAELGSIGLVSTSQYPGAVAAAKEWLASHGIEARTATHARAAAGRQTPAVPSEGQILGCDFSAALPLERSVDAFLYIGSGKFHPLGLARATELPVLALDVETGELTDYAKERKRVLSRKLWAVAEAKEAKRFGVLLSSKPGQGSAAIAEKCAKELRAAGREAWVLVMDFLAPEKLVGLKLDALVNVACPRIDEDAIFKMPVVNPSDLPAVLGSAPVRLAAINNVPL